MLGRCERGHVGAANRGGQAQAGGRCRHGLGLVRRAGAERVIEVGDGETPAAVARECRRSVQERGRVRPSGHREDDGGAIGDLEASRALGQGVGDRLQCRDTTWRGVTAHL
jgi:hypothetical protein